MIAALNQLVDVVERTAEELDVAAVASAHGTTEHHLRRMFSSLAGMPLTEYVRRRRMSLAAADVAAGEADLLDVAIRHGYGSTEAFGRAFRSVHGTGPSQARRDGGPFHSQQPLRFRLTVEGKTPMNVRIVDLPAIRLVGHATRVPLQYEGVNPHIQEFVTGLPVEEHQRLKGLGDTEPEGLLQVTDDLDPDSPEGSELTYLHGVAVTASTRVPDDLSGIAVDAGRWAVFTSQGPHPQALQETWAATAAEWFPSHPWQLRPGPSFVRVLDHDPGFTRATCEVWMPVSATS